MMSRTRYKIAATLGTVVLGAVIAPASSQSGAAPARSAPAPIPRIIEVSSPFCGLVPVFAGPRPALNLDPTAGQSNPAAFDRLSGLPMGGAWCWIG